MSLVLETSLQKIFSKKLVFKNKRHLEVLIVYMASGKAKVSVEMRGSSGWHAKTEMIL